MKNVVQVIGCVSISMLLAVGSAKAATIDNYCIQPSFISGGSTPNLLLMIDNSASMSDLQYTSSATCYDKTYNNSNPYDGYFSRLENEVVVYPVYQYQSGKFVEYTSPIPTSGGTYMTGYLYLELTGSGSTRTVTNFIASGRFLNWLTASKFDIQKKILTGGKYANGVLIGESRGCVGNRYVKELFNGSTPLGLTFAVKGPATTDAAYDPNTGSGQTTIELYEKQSNATACTDAATNWNAGNYGQASTDTKNCLSSEPGSTTLNHAMQTCWLIQKNKTWNITDVTVDCTSIYNGQGSTAGIAPNAITDKAAPYYVCSSAAQHITPTQAPYNSYGSNTDGYVGRCWSASDKFTGKDSCVREELLHYCMGVQFSQVIDPSSDSLATTGLAGVPSVLMDAGVTSLGAPVGTYLVKVSATNPSGLIQDFSVQNHIRFGAMSFNFNGSAAANECGATGSNIPCPKVCSNDSTMKCTTDTDCGTGTCTANDSTNKDGGRMLPNSYIGDPVGDHSSGLIKNIDDVKAETWTPFAEAFYNAIAYFTKDAIATNPALAATKFTPATTAPLPIATPLNSGDINANKNPILYSCQHNNILLITDGQSTADIKSTVTNKVTDSSNVFRDPATLAETGATSGVCGIYAGSPYLHDLSYYAYHRNIFDPSKVCPAPAGSSYSCETAQTLSTHVVYSGTVTNNPTNVCDSYTQMAMTATNGGTTIKTPANPEALRADLKATLQTIAAGVSSGTAASILSNSEGSGANLLQAVFYPKKIFENLTEANWIGEMQNMWYYVDPFISNSTVREDTDFSSTTPNHILNLKNDYVVRFYFENGETKVERKQDTDGDGLGNDPPIDTALNPDNVKSLWRAGRQLWARSAGTRTIHTSINGYSLLPTLVSGKGGFYTAYTAADTAAATAADTRVTALQPYLQASGTDSNAEAVKIINYMRGTDQSGYRPRSVSLLVNGATVTKEWKLGDIISSTPRLQSTNKLNTYNLSAPAGYSDKSYGKFINSSNYLNRGMAYVGANDGMLHAFKLGKLTVAAGADTGIIPSGLSTTVKIGGFVKASLTGENLGEEQWTFIPRSALPYLKYYTDADNYKHIYYLDGPTVLSDISIAKTGSCSSDYSLCPRDDVGGTNWRTVLIGSMGLGGATRLKDTLTCVDGVSGTCVKTPIYDPDDTAIIKTKGVGYSSYFALDITDQYFNTDGTLANQPVLKWEFPPRDAADNFGLGYATSGAAIIKISPKLPADANGVIKPNTTANGKWFAVFASGPTGPINTTMQRFMGRSDQNLKLFVVDLGATVTESSPFVLNTNYWVIDTGIANAFGGTVVGGAIDADRWNGSLDGNYQDDALYVGYTKKRIDSTGEVTWTDGGVGRLLTKESTDPSEWVFSKVIDGIGPVTTGISRLQDRNNKKLWLYFGTGRFFYSGDDSQSTQSAANNQRYLMGVQEECYTAANTIDPACSPSTPLTLSSLKDQTTSIATVLDSSKKGWYVELDPKNTADNLGAERSITDAVALTNGGVFFTTFKPTSDICKFGGYSYVWGFNYATGGAAAAAALTGKVLIQVSTGAFEEVSLSTALTANQGRKMGTPMIGKPPVDAPPIISSAANKPLKKIMHIQEK